MYTNKKILPYGNLYWQEFWIILYWMAILCRKCENDFNLSKMLMHRKPGLYRVSEVGLALEFFQLFHRLMPFGWKVFHDQTDTARCIQTTLKDSFVRRNYTIKQWMGKFKNIFIYIYCLGGHVDTLVGRQWHSGMVLCSDAYHYQKFCRKAKQRKKVCEIVWVCQGRRCYVYVTLYAYCRLM